MKHFGIHFRLIVLACLTMPCIPTHAEDDDLGLQRQFELGSYSFLSKSWYYFGDLAYQTSLLIDDEGNFLGISFTLMNRSRSKSLTLSRHENLAVPFVVHIRDLQDNPLKNEESKAKQSQRVKWMVKPRARETYFIRAVAFLPENFEFDNTKRYSVTVDLAATQEGYVRGGHVGPASVVFNNLGITNASSNGTKALFKKMSAAASPPGPRSVPRSK